MEGTKERFCKCCGKSFGHMTNDQWNEIANANEGICNECWQIHENNEFYNSLEDEM